MGSGLQVTNLLDVTDSVFKCRVRVFAIKAQAEVALDYARLDVSRPHVLYAFPPLHG
jgi:hypothetical protein